jgi:hypothetical protein
MGTSARWAQRAAMTVHNLNHTIRPLGEAMWSHMHARDIPAAAILLAVLTITFDLTMAIILVTALAAGVAAARRDAGTRP